VSQLSKSVAQVLHRNVPKTQTARIPAALFCLFRAGQCQPRKACCFLARVSRAHEFLGLLFEMKTQLVLQLVFHCGDSEKASQPVDPVAEHCFNPCPELLRRLLPAFATSLLPLRVPFGLLP
jgi:hypothetical protein